MPSHTAPGFSEVPADLFKQALISFQKRIHLLVNELLTGGHECNTELLMAKVILIHKDKDIAILDHYRPIALLNTIYQLIMLIITSRLRQLTENFAVMKVPNMASEHTEEYKWWSGHIGYSNRQ